MLTLRRGPASRRWRASNPRQVGLDCTRAGTPFAGWVQGEPKSPARGQPAQRLDGGMRLNAEIPPRLGDATGARSGPLAKMCGTTTHILRTTRSVHLCRVLPLSPKRRLNAQGLTYGAMPYRNGKYSIDPISKLDIITVIDKFSGASPASKILIN